MVRIDLRDLPFAGDDFEGEEPSTLLDLTGEDGEVRIVSPVRYAFHVQLAGDELIASGRIEVDVAFACSRCGGDFTTRMEEPSFLVVRDVKKEKCDQFVDLTPDIRESILLAFPAHPVCRPACKGLCPQCGANWNNESCTCRPPPDGRWGGLEMLETRS